MEIEIYSGVANYTRLPADTEETRPEDMRGLQDLRELNIYEIQQIVSSKVDYRNILGLRNAEKEGRRYANVRGLSFSIPGNYRQQMILEETADFTEVRKLRELATLSNGQVEFLRAPEDEETGFVTIYTSDCEGEPLFFKARIEEVPYRTPYLTTYAYTDGASVEEGRYEDFVLEDRFVPYGGGFVIYDEKGNPVASSAEIRDPVAVGLAGVAPDIGNANLIAELETAMQVLRQADRLGMQEITIFYDNEQIAGSAAGGLNRRRKSGIARQYYQFLSRAPRYLKHLQRVRLVHVEAHRDEIVGEKDTFPGNREADILADALRDRVMQEFQRKRGQYLSHLPRV